jgi:magnesium transporter
VIGAFPPALTDRSPALPPDALTAPVQAPPQRAGAAPPNGNTATSMIVDCAHYVDRERQHEAPLDWERISGCLASGQGFVWLGMRDPSEEELARAHRVFDLPPLAVEDVAHAHQRPKLEDYDGRFFIVLKTAWYEDAKEEVHFGEIHVFLGPNYVVTVRHGEASDLRPARARLEGAYAELLDAGPAAVAWAVVDQVVDDYEPVAAGIEDDIEEVEEEVFARKGDASERIYFLKREVIEFHRATFPLLPPLEALERGAFPQIPEQLRRYFRDVSDHARRIDEAVNSQRELLTSILEANLSLVGVRQNENVQAISAWAAIIAVPTFLASIWGMNFEHMPELAPVWGYPFALLMMLTSTVLLHRFFRRIGWL